LKEWIVEMLASPKRAHPLPALSWKESTQRLLDTVAGGQVRDAAL